MQISISARHGQLGAGVQDRISEKVEKLCRYFDRVTGIQVTVDLEHEDAPTVELRVSAEHSGEFVATADGANVFAALDGAVHKLEQQLRKHKERRITDHRGPGRRQAEAIRESEPETE